MDLGLKGKTAIVTGATRGIGRAIADLFADEGANVAICARNADQVAETVAALEAKGVKAFGQVVDIAEPWAPQHSACPQSRAALPPASSMLAGRLGNLCLRPSFKNSFSCLAGWAPCGLWPQWPCWPYPC